MPYTVRQNPAGVDNFTEGRLGNGIDKIVIHHAATTDFDGIGRTFKDAVRGTSAHYGVGEHNNVDQYVPEGSIAWHAGNWPVNCTSIGIETVNHTGAPNWDISDSAFATLVELVRDIARRNGLLPLRRGVNLFGHHDFIATACPAQLYNRLDELVNKVNGSTSSSEVVSSAVAAPDQVLHVGERFVFDKSYVVNGLAFVGGIWQIQSDSLCKSGFTWNDNGIPAGPVTEVAGGVGNANDQILQVGSLYKIPGTYTVLNLGYNDGMWLAEIEMDGYRLWVDIATVTEV